MLFTFLKRVLKPSQASGYQRRVRRTEFPALSRSRERKSRGRRYRRDRCRSSQHIHPCKKAFDSYVFQALSSALFVSIIFFISHTLFPLYTMTQPSPLGRRATRRISKSHTLSTLVV